MVEKKEFKDIILNLEDEIFVVHIAFFAIFNNVYLFCRVKIALLNVNEALIIIFPEYYNFINIFFLELIVKLSEHIEINNYAINLVNDKQPPYKSIYSLRLVELETLKTDIKTNLANSFIKPFKSYTSALVLFF